MSESLENIKDKEQIKHESKLTFEDKVIAKISRISIEKIDGLLEMKGNLFDSVADRFTNADQSTAGVDVEVGEKEAAVDLQVILEYGVSAVKLFEEVKKAVKENVKKMTGLDVVEVNVHIVDVMTREEYKNKNIKKELEK
ncbi:MAG: Asp23/Gls24 family envelope stress response protein [Peptoniphilaceae bacterium]|nr:Asp23/Gls24 family envelope stress response protein [Peptoniphilaceae bacterium]MDD7383248.1 Asp23/Gls24 family envelope stress response protein [Peptoniphilaceae bacterium]MDY3737995.1 Asp23/Gls24 family envelope stress response protein [Peptoniphilaceae bacterium]